MIFEVLMILAPSTLDDFEAIASKIMWFGITKLEIQSASSFKTCLAWAQTPNRISDVNKDESR